MADFTPFSDRDTFNEAEALALQESGALVVDPRRSRPLWFDGRFLTARDLQREQNYFLTRQKDVGRATGRGVIEGLRTSAIRQTGANLTRLAIEAGHGIAFDGNHVILPEDIEVDLAEIAIADGVNVRLGLSERPAPSLRNLSGLFVLSLRPVEYTANPVASYPTSLDGERGLHSSDIVEAVAVTLTPFSLFDAPLESTQTRAYAAKQVFLDQSEMGLPGFALPLAMLSLDQGRIDWLDEPMVRRELAALGRDTLGLGLSQDALRLAHYEHYSEALEETVASYEDAGSAPRFAASDHFRTLPAAGRLPSACIDAGAATQSFFPAEMEVDLSLVPDDELAALIEESFAYPPIDLTRAPEEQENVSILILAPVSRTQLREEIGALKPMLRPIRPATLFGYGHVKPIERIKTFRLSLRDLEVASQPPAPSVTESAWSQLVRRNPYLWYLRRRSLSRNLELESVLVPVAPAEAPGVPEEPPSDSLDIRIAGIVRNLSALGSVASAASAEFERLGPDNRVMLAGFLEDDPARALPLISIAGIERSEALPANSAEQLTENLKPLVSADVSGIKLLTEAVLGNVPRDIPKGELDRLTPLVVSKHLTDFVAQVPGMPATTQKEILAKLESLLDNKDPAAIDEFLSTGGGKTRPKPAQPGTFLGQIAQPGTRRALEKSLDGATPAGRDIAIEVLTKAETQRSRVALAAATKLATKRRLTGTNAASQLKGFTQAFVDGLEKVEARVLDKVAAGADESKQDRIRISLLADSGTLPLISEVGQTLGPQSQKLIGFSRALQKALDTRKAKPADIAAHVKAAHKELIR